MAKQAKEVTGANEIDVDRGYFTGEEILACDETGITTYLPKPKTSGKQGKGQYGKRDFIYNQNTDEYKCPAGNMLTCHFS